MQWFYLEKTLENTANFFKYSRLMETIWIRTWSFCILQTWKSLPDSNEVLHDFPGIVLNSIESTLDWLASWNMFFIAKRKHANQDVLYLSANIPRGIPFLIELTAAIGIPGLKCAVKTPNPEMAPLFFEALEALLKSWLLSWSCSRVIRLLISWLGFVFIVYFFLRFLHWIWFVEIVQT